MPGENMMPSDVTMTGPIAIPARRSGEAAPAAPSQSPSLASEALKRWLDVVLRPLLLVVAAVVLLPACVAIMLDSPGLSLYRQWRSGKAGRPFRILKLRPMAAHADLLGPALPRTPVRGSSEAGQRSDLAILPRTIGVVIGGRGTKW